MLYLSHGRRRLGHPRQDQGRSSLINTLMMRIRARFSSQVAPSSSLARDSRRWNWNPPCHPHPSPPLSRHGLLVIAPLAMDITIVAMLIVTIMAPPILQSSITPTIIPLRILLNIVHHLIVILLTICMHITIHAMPLPLVIIAPSIRHGQTRLVHLGRDMANMIGHFGHHRG